MHRGCFSVASVLALALTGCGAQGMLLGTKGSYLLTAMDGIVVPGGQVRIRAKLRAGDMLSPRAGYVILFRRNGELFKAAQTDAEGVASVSFTPPRPGDYRFSVELSPVGLSDVAPAPGEALIACRSPARRIVIVDMDKTIVASGFGAVLIGKPKPMAGSARVLARLAKTHTIVYLTHRPDYFGPKSKAWLKTHNYPPGPVLLSSAGGFLKGSSAFKARMLTRLTRQFKHIEIGIGDQISDAAVYYAHGLKSFLILQPPSRDDPERIEQLADELARLPDQVQVVSGWGQIAQALFDGASWPRSAAEGDLRRLASRLASQAKTRPATRPTAGVAAGVAK